MVAYTSIQILPSTREKLASLKESEWETYDELLNKLLELVPEGDDEGKFSEDFRIGLLPARLDLKCGNVVSNDELRAKLGF